MIDLSNRFRIYHALLGDWVVASKKIAREIVNGNEADILRKAAHRMEGVHGASDELMKLAELAEKGEEW